MVKLYPSRNTSTGVEKTGEYGSKFARPQKHLHGRGEDVGNHSSTDAAGETPPRAWRRSNYPS